MGESVNELQIRVGVSVGGVQESARVVKDVEPRVARLQKTSKEIEVGANKLERRLAGMSKNMLKMVGKQAIAGALTEGIDALMPNNDLNAMNSLRNLGTNVSIQSLFMGLKYGPFIGIVLSAIQAVRTGLDAVRDQVKEDRDTFKRQGDRLKSLDDRMKAGLQSLKDDFDQDVADIRRKTYLELRSGDP